MHTARTLRRWEKINRDTKLVPKSVRVSYLLYVHVDTTGGVGSIGCIRSTVNYR